MGCYSASIAYRYLYISAMKSRLSILLLLATLSTFAADSFTGKVVGVADGDTITVLREGNVQVKVRLDGVDCPEKAQDFGLAPCKACKPPE